MIGSCHRIYAIGSFIELFDNVIYWAVLQLFCDTGEPALVVVAQVVGVTVTAPAWESVGQVCVRLLISKEWRGGAKVLAFWGFFFNPGTNQGS